MSLIYCEKMLKMMECDSSLKDTFQKSKIRSKMLVAKQLGCTVGGSAIGGISGGPRGALIGGLFGVAAGAMIGYFASDEFQSLIKVLRNLSTEEKKELVRKIQELVGANAIEDFKTFIGNEDNGKVLLDVINDSLKEMRVSRKVD